MTLEQFKAGITKHADMLRRYNMLDRGTFSSWKGGQRRRQHATPLIEPTTADLLNVENE